MRGNKKSILRLLADGCDKVLQSEGVHETTSGCIPFLFCNRFLLFGQYLYGGQEDFVAGLTFLPQFA